MQMPSAFSSFREKQPLAMQVGYGWIKSLVSGHPTYDDPEFEGYYRWLLETQWWTKEQLKSLQVCRLQALLAHAYENVPYYRRRFDEIRLKPVDIRTLDDLQKLPLLTKEDVRQNLADLMARNIDREKLVHETTGGSTGMPLSLYQDKKSDIREAAFTLRQWKWAGYHRRDRTVRLRGLLPAKEGQRAWDYLPLENRVELLGLDMNESHLQEYVNVLKEFRPKFIYSYPSSLEILAQFMKRSETRLSGISAIFCEVGNVISGTEEVDRGSI